MDAATRHQWTVDLMRELLTHCGADHIGPLTDGHAREDVFFNF
jgi:hypothetical protein